MNLAPLVAMHLDTIATESIHGTVSSVHAAARYDHGLKTTTAAAAQTNVTIFFFVCFVIPFLDLFAIGYFCLVIYCLCPVCVTARFILRELKCVCIEWKLNLEGLRESIPIYRRQIRRMMTTIGGGVSAVTGNGMGTHADGLNLSGNKSKRIPEIRTKIKTLAPFRFVSPFSVFVRVFWFEGEMNYRLDEHFVYNNKCG